MTVTSDVSASVVEASLGGESPVLVVQEAIASVAAPRHVTRVRAPAQCEIHSSWLFIEALSLGVSSDASRCSSRTTSSQLTCTERAKESATNAPRAATVPEMSDVLALSCSGGEGATTWYGGGDVSPPKHSGPRMSP